MALNIGPEDDYHNNRQYITVKTTIDPQCNMVPLSIVWINGREYEIDRVMDTMHTAQLKTGGSAYRYTVRIQGKQRYLYFDPHDFRWFVEIERPKT